MFRFYKLYSLYMDNTGFFGQQVWCVCEKLPRALIHVPVSRYNVCEVCGLSRRPRSLLSGSSDEEEKLDAERQKMLLQRRHAEEAAQKNKAARFKVGVKGRKPQTRSSRGRGSGNSGGMARTAGGGLGEAGDGCPDKLPPILGKMDRRYVDRQPEPSAPPPSSPSPPPAPSGSPREEMHPNYGRKRLIYDSQAVKKFTPLKGPITDPSGGAISKRCGHIWGTPSSHLSRPQAPLSSVHNKQKMQGGGSNSSKSKPKYTDSQLASQFAPFEEYDGPSEDALVVDEARRMLSRPNSLYMDQRPDLPNNRIGNYGSSLGRIWVSPHTLPPAPVPKPSSGPSTDKSPLSEESKADTKDSTNSSSASSSQADGAEGAGKSNEPPVKPTEKSEYDEILENLGLMELSNEKKGNTVDDLPNENVVSPNKTKNGEEYSEVLSTKHSADSKGSSRLGGSLLKASAERVISVKKRISEFQSPTSKCNKCDLNARNHKRSEDSKLPRKLEDSVSVKFPKLIHTASKERVCPAPRKKYRWEDMPIQLNPICSQSVAPRKTLPKQQVRVESVAKKQVKGVVRVPPVTRKQKPEDKKLVTRIIKTFETVYHMSGDLPKPKMASIGRQLAGNLSESDVHTMTFFEFRVPDIDLSDSKDSGWDHSHEVEENASRPKTPISHFRFTKNIKTFERAYHMSADLPIPKMASFDKKLMGNLSKSYVPLLNFSKVVPKDLEDSPRVCNQKVEANSRENEKLGERLSESKSSTSKCTKCGHVVRIHKEGDPRERSEESEPPRKFEESAAEMFTKLKSTARKQRVCRVNSDASFSRRRKQRMIEMEIKKLTWEDLLVLSKKIAYGNPVERSIVTGNIEVFESAYHMCGDLPKPQMVSFVGQLVGKLSERQVRNPPAMSFFDFRVPDIDISELQYACQDHSQETGDYASRPDTPIPHIASSPEGHDRSVLQTKKKARAVWPDWSVMETSEGFVRQRKSLIQKEEVFTRFVYDQNSSQSDSLEEKEYRSRRTKPKPMKLIEETKWKRYDQVEELEIKHEKRRRDPAQVPELSSETSWDSGNKSESATLHEFRKPMNTLVAPTEYLHFPNLEDSEIDEMNPTLISLKLNTKNERYPFANDMKESQVVKQAPEKVAEMFGTDSDGPSEPVLTHRRTAYPGLPALNWQVIKIEKDKTRLSTKDKLKSRREKACNCPVYKCEDSLTPRTMATHFKRDHRYGFDESYHRVVEGLPTQLSFNCESLTHGNTFVTLLLYNSIRRDTPRQSSPFREHPLVLLAAPDRIKNGLPTGIFFWIVSYPTDATLLAKLSISNPLEFNGCTRIIQSRDISKRQNPIRFLPDSTDHVLLQLPCKKPGCVQMCVVIEEDVKHFRA